MSDKLTLERRSWNMSRIKGKDTKIEVKSGNIYFQKNIVLDKMMRDILVD